MYLAFLVNWIVCVSNNFGLPSETTLFVYKNYSCVSNNYEYKFSLPSETTLFESTSMMVQVSSIGLLRIFDSIRVGSIAMKYLIRG